MIRLNRVVTGVEHGVTKAIVVLLVMLLFIASVAARPYARNTPVTPRNSLCWEDGDFSVDQEILCLFEAGYKASITGRS
jgi:hypothetical protein